MLWTPPHHLGFALPWGRFPPRLACCVPTHLVVRVPVIIQHRTHTSISCICRLVQDTHQRDQFCAPCMYIGTQLYLTDVVKNDTLRNASNYKSSRASQRQESGHLNLVQPSAGHIGHCYSRLQWSIGPFAAHQLNVAALLPEPCIRETAPENSFSIVGDRENRRWSWHRNTRIKPSTKV